MDDVKRNPNSRAARRWAFQHTLAGSGSFWSTMRGYVMGPTDEEARQLGVGIQDEIMAAQQQRWQSEEKKVKLNPAWRVREYERDLHANELTVWRYQRHLQWNPI
jgi:hypothetical protein